MTSDFSDMADRVRDLKDDLRDGHREATRKAMRRMVTAVENTIQYNRSVARRNLVNDVQEDPQAGGANTISERSVHVPEWAKYLEHGTGPRGGGTRFPDDESFAAPSKPPYQYIKTWAQAKGIVPRKYETVDDLASAIAVTIAEEGTFPHPFLRPTWYGPRGYRTVVNENKQAMRRALKRL